MAQLAASFHPDVLEAPSTAGGRARVQHPNGVPAAELIAVSAGEVHGSAVGTLLAPAPTPAADPVPDPALVPSPNGVPARRVLGSVEPLIHLLAGLAAVLLTLVAGALAAGAHVEAGTAWLSETPWTVGAAVAGWPLLLGATGVLGRTGPLPASGARARGVLRAAAVLGLLCWVAGTVLGELAAPGVLLPPTLALCGASLTVVRVIHAPRRPARIVVAGAPDDVAAATAELSRSPRRLDVVAACSTDPREALDDAVGRGADALVIAAGLDAVEVRRLQWAAERAGLPVCVGTGLTDIAAHRATPLRVGGLSLLQVQAPPASGVRRTLKSAVERTAAAAAIVVLSPLLLGLLVAVRRNSPGPGLYRQRRVGRDGSTFMMLKFRTMRIEGDRPAVRLDELNEADGCLFKIRQDPRVTSLGQALRRYSLDELPQLWNIVAGQMSLVGPRPALPGEVAEYDGDTCRRLAVLPGLTGLWQVSGRSDLSWQESVRLDLEYVDNWSLTGDLAILRRTFDAVVSHRGAY